jgi:SAM-dependent methyltransferase
VVQFVRREQLRHGKDPSGEHCFEQRERSIIGGVMPHRSHEHQPYHDAGAIEGRQSDRYDRIARLFAKPFYNRMAKEINAIAPRDATVLDVGTGPGVLLKMLGKARPDLRLTGIDIADDMIDHAKHNLAELATTPELRAADVADLPFEDDRFDLVVSTFSSHHWEDPEAGAAEIARVLRSGGRLRIYDFRDAPFDAVVGQAGLTNLRQAPFRSVWTMFMKATRFDATAALLQPDSSVFACEVPTGFDSGEPRWRR